MFVAKSLTKFDITYSVRNVSQLRQVLFHSVLTSSGVHSLPSQRQSNQPNLYRRMSTESDAMHIPQASDFIKSVLATLKVRDPNQSEFLQAAEEVLASLDPLLQQQPKYRYVLPALCEPERVIQFRIPWQNRVGSTIVNRGFRVQYNQALGPYKGGLRLHPSVNLSIIKFLGFEQILKNALTGLPMGGGKGGSDFDPKGKTDSEILRFCQSMMTELYRHIGADVDVPAGDIGVGNREIGYLFGQYKRIRGTHEGVLTGKGFGWGGSRIRPQATGYGTVYMLEYAMADKGEALAGKRVAISGSGNVSQYAAEKCMQLDAKVLTFSDSAGTIHEPDGFTAKQFAILMDLKNNQIARCKEYMNHSTTAHYYEGRRPWHIKCDVALPCATQNEIDENDATSLVDNGCKYVFEGANMPSTNEAVAIFKNKLTYFPGKAANAGGVAVSGLEMAQNSARLQWTREEVDINLKRIMKDIYVNCRDTAKDLGFPDDFQLGANCAGFKKVADAMLDQGQVFISPDSKL